MAESHQLSVSACESLLRSHQVGRVAVSTPAGPDNVPVNYTVIEDAVIRTGAYRRLGDLRPQRDAGPGDGRA